MSYGMASIRATEHVRRTAWGRLVSVTVALVSAVPCAAAQTTRDDSVSLPLKATRSVEFTTDEGTWISLDVSPDGKTIVFDLLGDIYSIPVEGGDAKLIRGGHAWEIQ